MRLTDTASNTEISPDSAEIALSPTEAQVRAPGVSVSEFRGLRIQIGEGGGLQQVVTELELQSQFPIADEGVRRFARGLAVPILGKFLTNGIPVRIPGHLPMWDAPPVTALSGPDRLQYFLQTHPWGTIEIPNGQIAPAEVVARVHRMFPSERTLVLVRHSPKPLITELLHLSVPAVGTHNPLRQPRPGDVVVANVRNLGVVDPARFGLVLVIDPCFTDRDDPSRVTLHDPWDAGKICNLRAKLADVRGGLYCLRTQDRPLSPWEAAGHAEAFGMARLRLSPSGKAVERSVQVIMQPSTARLVIPSQQTPREVRHTAATCNVTLRRLANFVKAASRMDWKAVEKYLGRAGAVALASIPSFRHLIYVGTRHAADRLTKFLPSEDWPILDAESACQFEACGIIATEAGVRRIRKFEFDVIIRADFGPGLPPFPASWFTSKAPAPLYLIDFVAEQHPLLRRWTRSRQEAYLAADWREWGQHPAVHEYRRFLRAIAPRGAAR